MPMALEHNNVKYLQVAGDAVIVHFIDDKRSMLYPNGNGVYLPGVFVEGEPPQYVPYVPPTDPPPPGTWVHPAAGTVQTSPFGWRIGGMHSGPDMSSTKAPTGVDIHACTEMVITRAVEAFSPGANWSGGTYVKSHSTDGQYTFSHYHMAQGSLAVSAGQTVPAGTKLGVEGATGNVSGTHLHFEIIMGVHDDVWPPPYNNGAVFVDPLPILRQNGVNV